MTTNEPTGLPTPEQVAAHAKLGGHWIKSLPGFWPEIVRMEVGVTQSKEIVAIHPNGNWHEIGYYDPGCKWTPCLPNGDTLQAAADAKVVAALLSGELQPLKTKGYWSVGGYSKPYKLPDAIALLSTAEPEPTVEPLPEPQGDADGETGCADDTVG